MGVFSEIAMEQQNSMFDSSATPAATSMKMSMTPKSPVRS